jgi:hypothetical protein
MIAWTVKRHASTACLNGGNYRVRLKISSAAREDAWELCQVALRYGGVEVHDCCFAFADEEQWLTALEALRFRFGPEYFEPVDTGENDAGSASGTADSAISHGSSQTHRA